MADQRVLAIKTPVSEVEIAHIFIDIAKQLFNIDLSKSQLSLIIAQNNLETGHRQFMYNYNIGNITHINGDGFNYYIHTDANGNDIKIKEQIQPGKWVPMTMRFRSYPDIEAGVKDYLENLHKRAGGSVWQTIINSDPAAFSKALHHSGYYTQDEAKYTPGIVNGAGAFNKSDTYDKAKTGTFDKTAPVVTNVPHEGQKSVISQIESLLGKYLDAFSDATHTSKLTKRASYQQHYLPQEMLIKIQAKDIEDSIEFARLLSLALDEKLDGQPCTYTDNHQVEIMATVYGPKDLTLAATAELSNILAEQFTYKTGSKIKVKINQQQSKLPELTLQAAHNFYNKFHFKLIGNKNGK